MFRELTRKNMAATREECIRLLENEKRGVLSVLGDDGYPYGMPMNHWYNEEDGKLYFHCLSEPYAAVNGDRAILCGKICFYDIASGESGVFHGEYDWGYAVLDGGIAVRNAQGVHLNGESIAQPGEMCEIFAAGGKLDCSAVNVQAAFCKNTNVSGVGNDPAAVYKNVLFCLKSLVGIGLIFLGTLGWVNNRGLFIFGLVGFNCVLAAAAAVKSDLAAVDA